MQCYTQASRGQWGAGMGAKRGQIPLQPLRQAGAQKLGPAPHHPSPISVHISAQSLWLQTTSLVFAICLPLLSSSEDWDRCCPGV